MSNEIALQAAARKTRMTGTRRGILYRFACSVVKDTPIDKAITKRVANARTSYIGAYESTRCEAKAIVNKKFTEEDMKVLKRLECACKTEVIRLIDLDTRKNYQFDLFNRRVFNITYLGNSIGRTDHLNVSDTQVYMDACKKAQSGCEIYVPVSAAGYQPKLIFEASKKFVMYAASLKHAEDELIIAEELELDAHSKTLRDFQALIQISRTYEDVLKVWPEAEKVSSEVITECRALSTINQDAIERIRANMEARGVKLSEPTSKP